MITWASPMAQQEKNMSAMQETQGAQVQSLGREDPLEKENDKHLKCSCPKNSMDRETWQATGQSITKRGTRLSD